MKKLLALVLAGAMVLSLAACGSAGGSAEGEAEKTEESAEQAYVAMVLPGDINDGGWCQSAYEGLVKAGENYDIKTEYTEKVDAVDYESTIREYAAAGANLIMVIGSQFADACAAVAPDFPETAFAVFNGTEAADPNIAVYRYTTTETGFIAGVICATLSETGKVGMMIGSDAAHLADGMAAFEAGVKYVDESYTAKTANIDTMDDVAIAQETAQAFIDEGCDVLVANANTASLGSIQACESNGKKAVGIISDQYKQAPDTVMVSVVQDNSSMVAAIVESYLAGEFVASVNLFGMDTGAIYVSDWHGHDAELSAEQLDAINAAIEAIKDGSLKADGILPKTSFE